MATEATQEAIDWCNQARVLLKGKKTKTKARTELAKKLKALRKAMVSLEGLSATAAAVFEAEFHLVAQRAHNLTATKSDNVVEMITESAVGTLARIDADILVQTALIKRLKEFDAQLSPLEIKVAKLARLPGAQLQGSPVRAALESAQDALVTAAAHREDAATKRLDSAMSLAVDALSDAVTKCAKAERSAEVMKKEAEQDAKDAKVWLNVKPEVTAALQEMSRLPGAEAITKTLQERWTNAGKMITQQDGLFVGYTRALAQLGDFKADLQRAREASKQLMSAGIPATVQAAKTAVDRSLSLHELVASPNLSQGWRDRAGAAANAGRREEVKALAELKAMQAQIDQEAQQLRSDQQLALAAAATFDQLLVDLAAKGVPASAFAAHESVGTSAKAVELFERQWGAATTRLNGANQVLARLLSQYSADGPKWSGYRDALNDIKKRAGDLANFPVVRAQAVGLTQLVSEVLTSFTPTQLQRGIAAFEEATFGDPALALPAAIDQLERLARSKNVPVGDAQALADYKKALKNEGFRVAKATDAARLKITNHLDGVKSLTPEQRALLSADFAAQTRRFESRWVSFSQGAGGDPDGLVQEVDRIESDLDDLVVQYRKLQGDALSGKVGVLVKQEADQKAADLPGWIVASLKELRGLGLNVSAEQSALDAARGKPDEAAQMKALGERLTQRVTAWRAEQAAAGTAVRDAIKTQVQEVLAKLTLSKDFRQEMAKRCSDTVELTTMGDPDLLEVAREMQRKLVEDAHALAAHPDQHKKNKDRLSTLSSSIGELMKTLPETHRRLSTKDTQTRVLAKTTDPIAMVKLIDELEVEVNAAITLHAQRKRELERYDEAKKEVEKAFAAMKKATSTRLTDKAEAFEKYYEARLKDASAHKSREDGFNDAISVLNSLKARLAAINDADNPEAALRKLDSDEVQNQALLVSMARQFEIELANFKDVMLPRAMAAAEAADDGDTEMVKSLHNVAGASKRIVSKYTQLLTLLKRGSEPAPDMTAARADFEKARAILGDAIRTAQRLIDSPVSTNVVAPSQDGLRKLGVKWQQTVQAHAQALQAVAKAMRDAANADPQPTKDAAEKAAKMVEALGSTLRADAFAASFAGLMKAPPEDKAGREAAERERLAQREVALRVMRNCRTELTENPLRRMLTDGAVNPFEAATLMAASAALRVTLKEIELQALNSV